MNHGSWVAIDASTDRRSWARKLARIHHQVAAGAEPPPLLREPIANSWRRCASAGFDPEHGTAPVTLSPEEAADRWRRHPLVIAEPLLRELLTDVRNDDDQVVLACDVDGSLLWIDGDPAVLDAAHEIHLEPGALWSEPAAGTNAMGTALAVDHPIQVFSAEHFAEPAHGWTCSAAPVHDPVTGRQLGVIDLSGEASTAHPHTLALVAAVARMVEAELRHRYEVRLWLAGETRANGDGAALGVEALGRDRARIAIGDGWTELSRRHSEIVVLLALVPEGIDAERLARDLYGEYAVPVTARAELSRLRRVLGDRLPRGEHRLVGPLEADFIELDRLAQAGQGALALERYPGPLLPHSQVPLVIEARERLDLRLREIALASRDPALLSRWLETPSGRDDLGACRELVASLPDGDPARVAALSRLRRLSRDEPGPGCDNRGR
jgi:hypothetical protein